MSDSVAPALTPAQEARVKELIQAMLPAIMQAVLQAVDESLSLDLRAAGIVAPSSATNQDKHELVTSGTPEALHEHLWPAERADRLRDDRRA